MPRILCIDDTPDQTLESGNTLKETIEKVVEETTYEAIFAKTGEEGIELAKRDSGIKLVFLDIEFNGRIEGPEIADKLQKEAPHVKIIVLTRIDDRGKKISFGHKQNVVNYVVKQEMTNANVLQRVKNLTKAIIEDYENTNWELQYIDPVAINLHHKITNVTYGINIPSMVREPLLESMKSPNQPVLLPVGSYTTADLNKAHNIINTNVLEKTNWSTWGILSKEGCAKGQLKLVIGSIADSSSPTPPKDDYLSQSQFHKFKEDIESRLNGIEETLNTIKNLMNRVIVQ